MYIIRKYNFGVFPQRFSDYRVLDLLHYSFNNFVKASLLSVLWFRTKAMYMVEIVVVKTL